MAPLAQVGLEIAAHALEILVEVSKILGDDPIDLGIVEPPVEVHQEVAEARHPDQAAPEVVVDGLGGNRERIQPDGEIDIAVGLAAGERTMEAGEADLGPRRQGSAKGLDSARPPVCAGCPVGHAFPRARWKARSNPGSARTTVSRSTVSEMRRWPAM